MLGAALAAAPAASKMTGGQSMDQATSGDAFSGGNQGNITISTGGGKFPVWGWGVMAAGAVVVAIVVMRSK